MTGKEIHTQRNRFFMAFLEKSRKECVKMGLAHEKTSYLQEKANLFEIGSNINRIISSGEKKKLSFFEKCRLQNGMSAWRSFFSRHLPFQMTLKNILRFFLFRYCKIH